MHDQSLANAKHNDDVAGLIEHGAYRNVQQAEMYVENALAPAWRSSLGPSFPSSERLSPRLGFTPTMKLIVHLYARAVYHRGVHHSSVPVIEHWRGLYDGDDGRWLFPRAIAKSDIARIIGKSQSTVDDAIGRLRGREPRCNVLFEKRIAYPLWIPTGIMLDMMLDPGQPYQLRLEEYRLANKAVRTAVAWKASSNGPTALTSQGKVP